MPSETRSAGDAGGGSPAATAGEAAIEIRDLLVRRGGKQILPGISLRIPAGRVTGLLGPSGSGKTTLLRAIVGVQVVAGGRVTVLGQAAGTPALRRRVAYVTQEPSVYADLTVEENLRYFARILGAPRQRIEEVIGLVGLAGQTRQVTRTLSGGEFSRASLAVALLGKPELLVLDEPTVDVDPILRRELWQTFYDLAEAGASLLVSSHVMDEAARCHEIVLMRSGAIIATGSPAALLERTRTHDLEDAFVALAEAAMSITATLATAARVLGQLRRDRRTLAMVFLVAPALLTLFKYIFNDQPQTFDRIGAPMIGLFPLIMMFLITSIAMLRERTSGTLERLMSLPLAKLDLLLGYGLAFALLAALQGGITGAVGFGLLDVHAAGPAWGVVLLAIANALLGMALGLFLSAFARSEFQAVQFMPALLFPQVLLSGLLIPRARMPHALHVVSDALPVTYAYDALARVTADDVGSWLWLDIVIVAGAILLALLLGATTLRRRTP